MNSPVELALRLGLRSAPPTIHSIADEERALFTRVVREHGDALMGLARRLTPSAADAEDLLQETLLRAWRGLRKFRGDAPVRAWLYRILLNAWRSMRPRMSLAALDAETAQGPAADPARATSRRDLVTRVLAAVHRLPRRQRETLLLRARGGLCYAEIAEVMGIRKGAVKSHLVHARRKLLRRFGSEIREWGIEP